MYRCLGFVRLRDYAEERLGLGARTVQEMMRTEEALRGRPLVAAAFTSGRITSSHVRVLVRVVDPRSEKEWVRLASRLSVRELSERMTSGPEGVARLESGREESLSTIRMETPAWIAGLWRDAITLVRRLMGRQLPRGACLEMILAEFAGSLPAAGSDGAPGQAVAPGEGNAGVGSGEAAAGSCAAPSTEAPPAAEREDPPDARALDGELRRLVTLRQREEIALGERLLSLAENRAYRSLGYRSLEALAGDRFGLSPRRLYYLLALQRALRRLPRLRKAYLSGDLTLRKVLLIRDLADRFTESRWIARARSVTLRRLGDEVSFWRLLEDSRPIVWRLLRGGPIPEGIALAPGRPPRLEKRPHQPELHGSALSASALLRALERDEALQPLPQRTCRLEIRVERGVETLWREVVARCRTVIREDLTSADVLSLALAAFWQTWDNDETRSQSRRHRALERDGWRCTAPGCHSIGSGQLQEHHIVFRAMGGSLDDPGNVTTLCSAHHLGLLHRGWIRCRGEAPDGLTWELGTGSGPRPLMIFENERIVMA